MGEKKYCEMNNEEIRKITYESCPLKCTSCEALCNEMFVGQCRQNLSQKFDDRKERCMKTKEVIDLLLSKEREISGKIHGAVIEIMRLDYQSERGKAEVERMIESISYSLEEIQRILHR